MNDFHDRLLDAGLKEYARISVPENFAVRPVARRSWAQSWAWMFAPAAAAVAAAAVIVALVPAPLPGPPPRVAYSVAAPQVSRTARFVTGRVTLAPVTTPVGVRYRTLTAGEMARMDFPAGLFTSPEENPIVELKVQELSVKPLEGEDKDERN